MKPSSLLNKTVPVIIALLLLVSTCFLIGIQVSNASSSNVLVVPDNYANISSAINHAQPGVDQIVEVHRRCALDVVSGAA
jgi:hypothetical protein